ncbi:hypothetical protein [Kribbella sp. NPDC048915]|uniref:hypothetical protein n=1 Tax=Kribbella sp. NPDC048915 TaxID=3155148 RepID=UPI00340374D1
MSTRLRALGVVATVALLTGGCAAGTHPGAAAVVGGQEISNSQVDETARAFSAAVGEQVPVPAIVNQMVSDVLTEQVRQEKSITVADAEVAAAVPLMFNEQVTQKLQADPVSNEFLQQIATSAVIQAKLAGGNGKLDTADVQQQLQQGSAVVKQESKDIEVSVSPRYGRWTDGQLNTSISGSLSKESKQTAEQRNANAQPGQG